MTSDDAIDGARALRWHMLDKDPTHPIPRNPDSAIYKFWVENPFLWAPMAPEIPADDGTVYQAFMGAIVIWEPDQGCRVIH